MNYEINEKYSSLKEVVLNIPKLFEESDNIIYKGRNTIKILNVDGLNLNIKSFKIPNIVNRFAYKYVRPSKAKRSFHYGQKLLSKGINTPDPVAYIEYSTCLGLTYSYYISIHEQSDYTFRELIGRNIDEISGVLTAFTRFTYKLHEQGVYFIDHSPGNTLVKELGDSYKFSLVDLNRTKFYEKPLDVELGIRNFYRLGSTPEMVEIMAKEYARLRDIDPIIVLESMMKQTMEHNANVVKRNIKRGRINASKSE